MFSLRQNFARLRTGAAVARLSLSSELFRHNAQCFGAGQARLLTAHSCPTKMRFASPVVLKGTAEARRDTDSRELADLVCMDLEDAVPVQLKPAMRATLVQAVDGEEVTLLPGQTLSVRVNCLQTQPDLSIPDIQAMVRPGMAMLLLPKVNHGTNVDEYTEIVAECEEQRGMALGTTKYMVIVETARSFFNLLSIMQADDRVVAGTLGREDFVAETGGDSGKWNLACDYLCARFVLACHATGTSSLGSPQLFIDDFSVMITQVEKAKAQGFTGVWSLTPQQIAIIHQCFTRPKDANGLERELGANVEEGGACNTVLPTRRALPLSPGRSLEERTLTVGETLLNEGQERTVHQSWCTLWNMMLLNSSSYQGCKIFGCGLPHNLQMVLSTACSGLFSQCGKVVHGEVTGLFDAVHHRTLTDGDVIRVMTDITAVRPCQDSAHQSSGLIVETSHSIVNQRNDLCFSVTVHSRVADIDATTTVIQKKTGSKERKDGGSRWSPERVPECTQFFKFDPETMLIHPHVRSFLPCDITFLANFFDTGWRKDGTVAPSFVLSAALSNTNCDIGDIVRERVDACNFYQPVTTDQTMVNVTVVKSIEPCNDDPRLEDVEVVTLALININVSDVEKCCIPSALFSREAEVSIEEIEQISMAFCPLLIGQVALRVVRTVSRFRAEVVAASQESYDRKLPEQAKQNSWFH